MTSEEIVNITLDVCKEVLGPSVSHNVRRQVLEETLNRVKARELKLSKMHGTLVSNEEADELRKSFVPKLPSPPKNMLVSDNSDTLRRKN